MSNYLVEQTKAIESDVQKRTVKKEKASVEANEKEKKNVSLVYRLFDLTCGEQIGYVY